MSEWHIANRIFSSRLILGSSGYPSLAILDEALRASGTEMVTVAIRRVNFNNALEDGFLSVLIKGKYHLLPNTAGCYTAQDAILTAQLAAEALQTNWVKLEVIGDAYSLYPNVLELLVAARELVKKGFIVLPYCTDDPVVCKKLEDAGCAAVMPLGAPIGSGQGIRNPFNLELIKKSVTVPVIVDAGVGTASHAAIAMELGCDGVLMNTAIAKAQDPVKMASAMKEAVRAGSLAFEAGRIPEKKFATPSTPERGKIKSRQ